MKREQDTKVCCEHLKLHFRFLNMKHCFLGLDARYVVHCAKIIRASGIPILSIAENAASARTKAFGDALPISSDARTTNRLAMNNGSSPPSSILASQ